MMALDTNVIVRYLTGDDPEQSPKAKALIEGGPVWVSTTVLLETAWVLSSAYGFSPKRTLAALRAFAGLPRVSVEAPARAAQAFDWAEKGMDFADALHLAGAEACEAFATFDVRQIKAAAALGLGKVRAP